VRELQNRIRRALGTTTGHAIDAADLGFEEQGQAPDMDGVPTLKEARDAAEIRAVRQALALQNNNISQAAKLLQVSRPTLHDLLKKHGIET